jgi:hypothetical protein
MNEPTDIQPAKSPVARGKPSRAALRALSFTLGFLMAVVNCSLIGWQMSAQNIFHEFGRFHTLLSPESFFQPTAREVLALAKDVLNKSKINVIVGGSSVFYGVGQPEGQTLADNLRRELGSDYRVINLAMRGGDVSGIAELTAEMLLREQYRVVYLSDIAVAGTAKPIGQGPYQYFYWDARARHLLLDWPPRDSVVDESRLSEPVLSASLNRYLFFVELWNTIGYDYVFTVYSRLIPNFWQPRKNLADNEIDPPDVARYRDVELELRMLSQSGKIPNSEEWQRIGTLLEVALPSDIRRSTVLALCENSPWLLDQSSAQLRKNRQLMRQTMVAKVLEIGASALSSCEGLEKDDYIDRVHLSIQGALKIAPRLAEKVRAVVQKNRWTQ